MISAQKWCIALLCGLALQARAGAPVSPNSSTSRVIRLTSAEWPPYTGQELPAQGASAAVVRAALAAQGYRLEIVFFPWRRSVALATQANGVVGYFAEYRTPETAQDCLLSDPIGAGPLGLAERADAPIRWHSLDDLSQYTIGVVGGYFNTAAFDRRVREKKQPVDTARDDAQNLVKLAAGRVSLAIIDRRVYDYLTRHDPKVAPLASRLRFNPHLLEEKSLHVCFRHDPEGEQARRVLNDGLKKIDVRAVMTAALK